MSTGMPAGIWLTKFSTLGQQMTGLPIDFQIQPQTWANKCYPGPRSALIEIRP